MIQEPARVRLDLQSSPENVALVRAAVAGFAEALGLSAELTIDLQTSISEACNNTVVHAYMGMHGPLTVELEAVHDSVAVTVSDRGRGITRISMNDDRMGLGLAIISALADRAEFLTPDGGGTEVRMRFDGVTAVNGADQRQAVHDEVTDALSGDVIVWLSPVGVTRFVLGRILRAVAADAYFSVTRLGHLRAVNDAIAEYAELAADDSVGVAISSSRRRLSMTGGPFLTAFDGHDGSPTASERARRIRDRKRALDATVDTITSEGLNHQELLHMVVADASREN